MQAPSASRPGTSQKGGSGMSRTGGEEKGEGYEKAAKMSWASVMANGMAKDDEKKSDSEDGEPNLEDKNWVEKTISKQQREVRGCRNRDVSRGGFYCVEDLMSLKGVRRCIY